MMDDDKAPLAVGAEEVHGHEPHSPQPPAELPPLTFAAHSLAAIARHFDENVTAQQMLGELAILEQTDPDGRGALSGHTHVLDAAFHRIMVSSMTAKNWVGETVPGEFNETKLNLALRLQKQCRQAVETMNVLRWRDILVERHGKKELDEYMKKKNHERTR